MYVPYFDKLKMYYCKAFEALDPIPEGYYFRNSGINWDRTQPTPYAGIMQIYFRYDRLKMYTITVKDKFIDEFGVETTDIRQTDEVYKDATYTYNALDSIPDGYKLVSQSQVKGVATEDTEIEFRYEKGNSAYVTFSYSAELCDYLNDNYGRHYSPSDIVDGVKVTLGETNEFDLDFSYLPVGNISSFRTYYYDYNSGWSSEARYLGYPIKGLGEDWAIRLERKNEDSEFPESTFIQNCTSFGFSAYFSEYAGVDMDTMSCCHMVIEYDDCGKKPVRGIYRTVIDGLDSEDNIDVLQ